MKEVITYWEREQLKEHAKECLVYKGCMTAYLVLESFGKHLLSLQLMDDAELNLLCRFAEECRKTNDYESAAATLVMVSHWLSQQWDGIPPFESYAAFWVKDGSDRNAPHYCATPKMQKPFWFGNPLPAPKAADTQYIFIGAANNRGAGAMDITDMQLGGCSHRWFAPTVSGKQVGSVLTFFTRKAAIEFARLYPIKTENE